MKHYDQWIFPLCEGNDSARDCITSMTRFDADLDLEGKGSLPKQIIW